MNRLTKILWVFAISLLCNYCYAQFNPSDIKVIITNETAINTEQLEYSPAFYEDGIVYISTQYPAARYKIKDRRIDKNIMSTYVATRGDEGPLENPKPFATDLMTVYHEGPLTFDIVGEKMYFSRNNYQKGKKEKSSDGIIKLQIYSAESNGKGYSKEQKLSFNNKEYNFCHPAISADRNALYFASDMPGGLGGMDLYFVKRNGEEWGEPVNLGAEINSPGNDVFPSVHADGTLYYGSDGKGGQGKLDIFYASPKGESWKEPTNMGTPFNSAHDDFGFIIDRDKKNGYFSSNRPGGKGEDDIYSFYVKGDLDGEDDLASRDLWLIVLDEETGDVLSEVNINAISFEELISSNITTAEGNIIKFQPSKDNSMVLQLEVEQSNRVDGMTDMEGKFPLHLAGGKHIINLKKDGFQPMQLVLESKDSEEEVVVSLKRAKGCIPVNGSVVNDQTGTGVNGATITLVDTETGQEYEVTADQAGKFEYCVERDKKFELVVSKDNVIVHRQSLNTENSSAGPGSPLAMIIDVPGGALNAIPGINGSDSYSGNSAGSGVPDFADGTVIELPNIYYNFNDASIRPDAAQSLDALASILNRFPDIDLDLYSHTDSRGQSSYNQKLSQRRADKAVDYLAAQGISRDRLAPQGKGESELRNECSDGMDCPEDKHQYNRRTEVRVSRNGSNLTFNYVDTPPATSNSYTSDSPTIVDISSDYKSDKDYIVIAGTFTRNSNAKNRLKQLHARGFTNAKLVHGDTPDVIRVCVAEYNNLNEARELVEELKMDAIHSYVKFLKIRP